MRLLIVDDDTTVRETLAAFFEDEGMEVLQASSGEEAVAAFENGRVFDVCVMDIRLPGMDGNAAIRRLLDLGAPLRFIIYTGSAGYELPQDLQARGIAPSDVFKKPVMDMRLLAESARRSFVSGAACA